MFKKVSVVWYTRDGHVDLYAMVSCKLQESLPGLISNYVCNNSYEHEYLRKTYGISSSVLAEEVNRRIKGVDIGEEAIEKRQAEYSELPLVRSLWSTMYELPMPEERMVRYFFAHLDFWKEYLIMTKAKLFVGEVPSVISSCASWLACRRLGVKYLSFANIAIDERIVLTGSWEGYFDKFDDTFNRMRHSKVTPENRLAKEYISKMRTNPEKTKEVQRLTQKDSVNRMPFSLDMIRQLEKYWRRYQKRREYYLYPSIIRQTAKPIKYYRNRLLYQILPLFEKTVNPEKERFVLFTLHMKGEWSNYTWMGLCYRDQSKVIEEVAACLPIGYRLYVKPHIANFGEHPISFFMRIKKARNVRLIHPSLDTFALMKRADGLVTIGGTSGFESFVFRKPVITVGRPWYRNLPGIYYAPVPEVLAEVLQKIRSLPVASDEEVVQAVSSLYAISFEGVRYPHPDTIAPYNIENFGAAFRQFVVDQLS